ncbi:MAG TPA: GNAT family N-acetyltransferase [Candidatus Limnocylindrales bacterium]|nr:GNAT family N-acetyltransferase [Candidatus Limnocylindrales bacterium]
MTDRSLPAGIAIRAIRARDRLELERFYAALSTDSLDARFHGATRGIDPDEARTFCGPDHLHREGFVAVERRALARDRIVGHLCLEPIDGSTDLEMAIAVADEWQHHGIGRALLAAAIQWAAERSVERLHAAVRWSNPAILRLLRSADRPVHVRDDAEGDLDAVIAVNEPIPAAA